jgi:hypothetical protein
LTSLDDDPTVSVFPVSGKSSDGRSEAQAASSDKQRRLHSGKGMARESAYRQQLRIQNEVGGKEKMTLCQNGIQAEKEWLLR